QLRRTDLTMRAGRAGRGAEAAACRAQPRRVAGRPDSGWLRDGHRHQPVPAVDQEVQADPQGEPEDPYGILDDVVSCLERQWTVQQLRRLAVGQTGPGDQAGQALTEAEPGEACDP